MRRSAGPAVVPPTGGLDMWGQLALLRSVLETTGAMHEAQVLQLKMWPLIALPHVETHEFDWDVDRKRIDYRLKLRSRVAAPLNLAKRFRILDESIKGMLGDAWSICIKADDKKLFESNARRKPKRRPAKKRR